MTLTFAIESVEDGRFAVSFAKYIKSILLKNQEYPNLLGLSIDWISILKRSYKSLKLTKIRSQILCPQIIHTALDFISSEALSFCNQS
jgi:hypothetical protein